MVLIFKGEKGDKLRELAEMEDDKEQLESEIKLASWLNQQPLSDEYEIATNMAKAFNMNLTQVKKELEVFPEDCSCEEQNIPKLVKQLRNHRRSIKGYDKVKFTKGIENLINSYSSHLDNCIKSIYWVTKYEYPLKQMSFNEMDLKKIHSIKDYDTRGQLIDSLCKFWEADLEIKHVNYSKDYSTLFKQKKVAKREFRKILKDIPHQSIRTNLSTQVDNFIKKSVCDYPGISSREIHDRMPSKLYKITSPQIISKSIKKIGITNIDGANYKLPNEIKKDLYSYTASFIDSDGYITMDKSFNPRVGLVATGDRGKAFMIQIQKELGIGKLHLDQKSPQGTRPVNRLNFYSQADCHELLTKCLPHFRMKGKNAELLLELIKMKQGFKKEEWYKGRCEEIFKLMKWENHKDHVNYNFAQYGIDPTIVAKLHDNCKMGIMNDLESIKKGFWGSSPSGGREIKRWDVEDTLVPQIVKNYTSESISSYPEFTLLDVLDDIQQRNTHSVIQRSWVKKGLDKLIEKNIIIMISKTTSGQRNPTYKIFDGE